MILDTWKRAKRRSSEGVELMPPAGFQNYSSTASATTMFVFISMSPRSIYTFLRSSRRPIFFSLVCCLAMANNFSANNKTIRWNDSIGDLSMHVPLARTYQKSILFLLTDEYNISYFNLLKENGVPRLVAAKRKRSEWFSKIRLLRST